MKKIFVLTKIEKGDTGNNQHCFFCMENGGEEMKKIAEEKNFLRIASWKMRNIELPSKTQKEKINNWTNDRFLHSFIGRANLLCGELPKFKTKDVFYGKK